MLSFLMQTDAGALAPKGACLAWRPDVPWLHVASWGLTALAYWSVLLALAAALRQRRPFLHRNLVFPAANAAARGRAA